ncbi:MAG: hypothetical protein AAGI11_11320 [Pseudomonadota bacterium]
MKYRTLLAGAALCMASQAFATPAMTVVTVNTQDPVAYKQWAEESGPAIGRAINASLGGICISDAGFSAPGELYYWHIFRDHASALGASVYNETVRNEASKLKSKRTVSASEMLTMVVGEEPLGWEVGDTFSNWDLIISTEDVALYEQQLFRLNDAASENGFGDITISAQRYLTGANVGDMLVQMSAPTTTRLGEFLDQIDSDWMAPIMASLSGILSYQHGYVINCTVTSVKNK